MHSLLEYESIQCQFQGRVYKTSNFSEMLLRISSKRAQQYLFCGLFFFC